MNDLVDSVKEKKIAVTLSERQARALVRMLGTVMEPDWEPWQRRIAEQISQKILYKLGRSAMRQNRIA